MKTCFLAFCTLITVLCIQPVIVIANDDTVKLTSGDGQEFKVAVNAIKLSQTINNVIKDAGIDNPIPLPNVTGKTFSTIATMLQGLAEGRKNIVTEKLAKVQTIRELASLLAAINYLDIPVLFTPVLVDLAKKIAASDELIKAAINPDLWKILVNYVIRINGVYAAFVGASDMPKIRTIQNDGPINTVVFSPDGALLVTRAADHTLQVWDVKTGKKINTLTGHEAPLTSVSFSPDGTLIASGSYDQTMRIWDAKTGELLATLSNDVGPVQSVVFSLDGKYIAGAIASHIQLWDIEAKKEIQQLKDFTSVIRFLVFSPDNTMIASGSDDQTIQLWDVATGNQLKILKGHEGYINAIAFSPDGTLLASAGWDGVIRLWDIRTGKQISTLQGHIAYINALAFSRDGNMLFSAGNENIIFVWDVVTGKNIKKLHGHGQSINTMAVSPDGTMLASGADDKTIRLWRIGTIDQKWQKVLDAATIQQIQVLGWKLQGKELTEKEQQIYTQLIEQFPEIKDLIPVAVEQKPQPERGMVRRLVQKVAQKWRGLFRRRDEK